MLRTIFASVACAAAMPAQIAFEQTSLRHFPMDDAQSSKVSSADFDGDGDLDAVATTFTGSTPRHRFYRNDGQGIFTTHPGWPDVVQSGNHLVADIDGDGDADVMFNGAIARNNGGVFAVTPSAQTQDPVCFGDMTGDGVGDLFARYGTGHGVLLWRGVGGTFVPAPQGSIPTGNVELTGAELRDFDGDGDRDLLLATKVYAAPFNYWHGRDRLWINDGLGNFSEQILPGALDADTYAMAVADFDGDGDLDCAVSTVVGFFQIEWQLRLNDGVGNLVLTPGRLAGNVPANQFASAMRAMDLDGDGDMDIVGIGLWLANDGAAWFTQRPLPMPTGSVLQTDGDVDGDGDLDLVFAAYGTNDGMQRLLLNDGAQRFVDATAFPWTQAAGAAAFADLDGDGDCDVIGNAGPVGRNDGTGWFEHEPFPWQPGNVLAIQCFDADGDGDRDVVYVSNYSTTTLRLCRNDGNAHFVDIGTTGLPPVPPAIWSLVAFDADADGDLDLALADTNAGANLYRNDGSGAFTHDAAAFPAAPGLSSTLVHGDFDGDGDPDVLLNKDVFSGWLVYYANNGAGTFTDVSSQRLQLPANGGGRLAVGDLDGDGDLDALATPYGSTSNPSSVLLLVNTGGNLVATAGQVPMTIPVGTAALGDLDGDGDLDAVVGSYLLGVRFWANLGNATFTDVGGMFPPPSSLAYQHPRLADLDDDGDLDLTIGPRLFANQQRGLAAPWLCRIGKTFRVQFRSAGAGPSACVWPFFGVRQVRLPAGTFGTLVVDPASAAGLPPALLHNGEATIDYAIPQAAALVGAEVVVQGWIDSSSGSHFSPGFRVTVRN